jgi:hypothetical protein
MKNLTSKDINIMFGKMEGKKPIPCSPACKHYHFPHLDRPCVLSEVYSVKKGELCYNYELAEKRE